MNKVYLYMMLLGCKPPGRHVEQHDFFFGIAPSPKDLIPEIKTFWPEAPKIHIDAWRMVTHIDGFDITIIRKARNVEKGPSENHLFFINLGGYQRNVFSEQHEVLLSVHPDKAAATKAARLTNFFKHNQFDKATSHIDDQYALDVDEIYPVADILPAGQKLLYQIELSPATQKKVDEIHLGYFKLSAL